MVRVGLADELDVPRPVESPSLRNTSWALGFTLRDVEGDAFDREDNGGELEGDRVAECIRLRSELDEPLAREGDGERVDRLGV